MTPEGGLDTLPLGVPSFLPLGDTPNNVFAIMQTLGIKGLMDVRSKPFPLCQPGFNRNALGRLLGWAYLWRADIGGLAGNVIPRRG